MTSNQLVQHDKNNRRGILVAGLIILFLLLAGSLVFKCIVEARTKPYGVPFSGDQALSDVAFQVALGPRTVGSQAHDQVVTWMESELSQAGWLVERQETTSMGHPIQNVIAKRGQGQPWIILGAHYDLRLYADQDPDPAKKLWGVDGANDGASGVAVMLELARSLPQKIQGQIWLVMIDNEDNGDIPGWDWLLGSQAFVDQLKGKPDAAVIIDMMAWTTTIGVSRPPRSQSINSPVTRLGMTIGSRVWTRSRRR